MYVGAFIHHKRMPSGRFAAVLSPPVTHLSISVSSRLPKPGSGRMPLSLGESSSPMRVHCLQHVAFESLGALEAAFAARRATITTTRVDESPAFPGTDDFDVLVVLGGPMSVHDTAVHPWLEPEREFLKRAIDGGKSVLGICLGAQLIASALGARVFRNLHKEIGWFPVERSAEPGLHPVAAALPNRCMAFHWHGETFGLPPGALHLARSEGCPHQAFVWQDRVLALQFHLETTPEGIGQLTSHCPEDLAPGRYVQRASAMFDWPQRFAEAHRLLEQILAAWLGGSCRT